jgi:hypothetical protein
VALRLPGGIRFELVAVGTVIQNDGSGDNLAKRPEYAGLPGPDWLSVTRAAIESHPLTTEEVVDLVQTSWQSIFASSFGSEGFRIGKDFFPTPQVIGFLLHELMALELTSRYPDEWRRDLKSTEKDLIYLPDDDFSTEVKTSSNPNQVFGNRSYAQPNTTLKKSKDGYCITVNFRRPAPSSPGAILRVGFGWLDHTDWIAQSAPTGQQARLAPHAYDYKLISLPVA